MFTFLYVNQNGFDIEFTAPTDTEARSALKSMGEDNLKFISRKLSFDHLNVLSFGSENLAFNGVLSSNKNGVYIDLKNINTFIDDLNGKNNPEFMARLFGGKLVVYNNISEHLETFYFIDGYFYLSGFVFDSLSEVNF